VATIIAALLELRDSTNVVATPGVPARGSTWPRLFVNVSPLTDQEITGLCSRLNDFIAAHAGRPGEDMIGETCDP